MARCTSSSIMWKGKESSFTDQMKRPKSITTPIIPENDKIECKSTSNKSK